MGEAGLLHHSLQHLVRIGYPEVRDAEFDLFATVLAKNMWSGFWKTRRTDVGEFGHRAVAAFFPSTVTVPRVGRSSPMKCLISGSSPSRSPYDAMTHGQDFKTHATEGRDISVEVFESLTDISGLLPL
jgi:hypothetical protein